MQNRLSAATKNSRNANRNIKLYAWANLVRLWEYPLLSRLNPATTSNPDGYFLPVYDDAATVYADLLTRLNAAIPN
jgi:hypothetical protein